MDKIENCVEANLAVLNKLRQQQDIEIDLRAAFDLAKHGGFISIHVDQAALDALISELQGMSDDEIRAFRRDLARREITDPDQYPVIASN